MEKVLNLLALAIFFLPAAHGNLKLTTDSSSLCPTITLICSATDFAATTLRWFIGDQLFARYPYNPSDRYPLTVEPVNATYAAEIGGADVSVINATQTVENQDRINFVSVIKLNITALEEAGVSNISCGSLATRNTSSFTYRQVPAPTGVSIRPEYDEDFNLVQVQAMWNEVTSQDECRHIFSYHVIVVDESDFSVTEKTTSGSCFDGKCSTLLAFSSSNQLYRMNITALTNDKKKSIAMTSDKIYGSIKSYFKYPLVLEDCQYHFLCSSTLRETSNCSIQYGLSGQQLSFHRLVSLNSSYELSLETSTVYEFQIEFTLNSTPTLIKLNYTTTGVCLNYVHRGILIGASVCIIISVLTLSVVLILCWKYFHMKKLGKCFSNTPEVMSAGINTKYSKKSNWILRGDFKQQIHDSWEERFIAMTNEHVLEIYKSSRVLEDPEVYSEVDISEVYKKEDGIEIKLKDSNLIFIKPTIPVNLDDWIMEINVLTFNNILVNEPTIETTV